MMNATSRPLETAARTISAAVAAGNYATARRSYRAVRGLWSKLPAAPTVDEAYIWGLVVDVLKTRAAAVRAERIAMQRAYL